jgi:hypothetical protein
MSDGMQVTARWNGKHKKGIIGRIKPYSEVLKKIDTIKKVEMNRIEMKKVVEIRKAIAILNLLKGK